MSQNETQTAETIATIQTVFHSYRYNLEHPDEAAAYRAFKAARKADGVHCFSVLAAPFGKDHQFDVLDGTPIALELAHLFGNQWNTGPNAASEKGVRVFDWYHGIVDNQKIKIGHWLEQTAEMREIRRNTHGCGYCGTQEPAAKGNVFCPHCLDSEYLKSDDLHLLRMRPVCEEGPRNNRAPLTEAERAHLMPLYVAAQTEGCTVRGKARIVKLRADIEHKYQRVTEGAQTEHDGLLWLLDHGHPIGNVIYYTHTDTFCFGWRSKLSPEVVSVILAWISEFPYTYQIKGTARNYPEGA